MVYRKSNPQRKRYGLGMLFPGGNPIASYVKNKVTRTAQRFLGPQRHAIGSMARTAMRGIGKTKTNRRPRLNNVKVEGTGGQISSFKAARLMSPIDRKITKDLSPQYWYQNYASRLTATPGTQNYFTLSMFGNYPSVGDQNGDLVSIQNYVNAQIGLSNATATQGYKTTKFMTSQCKATYKMTNQDSGNTEVRIYDVAVRRDTGLYPTAAWSQGAQDESGTGTFDYSTQLGVEPTSSQTFNSFFKIKQQTRIILGAGQSHTHYVNIKPNKWIDGELVRNGAYYLGGYTMFTIILVSGMPYNDLTTQTQVSSGQCNLDIVVTKQHKYYVLQNATTQFNASATRLPTSFNVQEEVMQTGYGTKLADIPA